MSSLTSLLAAGVPNEADEAQRRSFVTYTLSSLHVTWSAEPTPTVTTLESRAIISSSGTTGLRTWEASLHLCNYLSSSGRDLIKDKHVLELGAGTGVLSILCAKCLNVKHVAATDGDEGIVDALRENIFLNGLEGDNRIESLVLRWGWPLSETIFADESPFDIVLGADIVRKNLLDCRCLRPLVRSLKHSSTWPDSSLTSRRIDVRQTNNRSTCLHSERNTGIETQCGSSNLFNGSQ